MNKMLLVIGGVAVCVVAAVVIYFGFGPRPEPVGYFAVSAKNQVIKLGSFPSWDDSECLWPSIIMKDGKYYLFYSGRSSTGVLAIGYATSTDGYNFTKSNSNPILTGAWHPAVLWDGNKWVLYYTAQLGTPYPAGPTWRATAPDLSGPWTRDEKPVLELGSEGEWDSVAILPDCVILVNNTYVMYYSVADLGSWGIAIGMATSPDGIRWTKYNNATTGSPYAESDPVLKPGKVYDTLVVWHAHVRKTATGWEMFYSGMAQYSAYGSCSAIRICYATSPDGIRWTKFEGNPVTTWNSGDPTFFVKDSIYFLYFGFYHCGGQEIDVATGVRPPFAP